MSTIVSPKSSNFAPELARRHVCVVSQKEKRSKKEKNLKCYKGCYVLRVHVAPNVTPFCNTPTI